MSKPYYATLWLLRAPAARGEASAAAPPAAPTPRLTLVCFPPAGSGGSLFQCWQGMLPAGVEVLAVEAPGRGTRMKEAPLASMAELVGALLHALLPVLDGRPFAFFGHSMGSWVAYQLILELHRRGGPLPCKFYASANRSPLLAGLAHDPDPTLMHSLPAEEFWAAMERRYGPNPSLAHPSLRRLLQPMMQADFRVIETWTPEGLNPSASAAEGQAGEVQAAAVAAGETAQMAAPAAAPPAQPHLLLPCPVVAIGAREDVRYRPEQLAAWREVATAGAFEQHWVDGGHTYVASNTAGRQQLLGWLSQDLQALLAEQPAHPQGTSADSHAAEQGDGASTAAAATAEEGSQSSSDHLPQSTSAAVVYPGTATGTPTQTATAEAAGGEVAVAARAPALQAPGPMEVERAEQGAGLGAGQQQGQLHGQGQQPGSKPAFRPCGWCWRLW